jgi:hypothetical protein
LKGDPVSGKEKAGLITNYLIFRFPMCRIELTDNAREDPEFRIDRGGKTDQLIISRDLIESCAREALIATLVQLDLYDLFSQAKGRKVLVMNSGVRFE